MAETVSKQDSLFNRWVEADRTYKAADVAYMRSLSLPDDDPIRRAAIDALTIAFHALTAAEVAYHKSL